MPQLFSNIAVVDRFLVDVGQGSTIIAAGGAGLTLVAMGWSIEIGGSGGDFQFTSQSVPLCGLLTGSAGGLFTAPFSPLGWVRGIANRDLTLKGVGAGMTLKGFVLIGTLLT